MVCSFAVKLPQVRVFTATLRQPSRQTKTQEISLFEPPLVLSSSPSPFFTRAHTSCNCWRTTNGIWYFLSGDRCFRLRVHAGGQKGLFHRFISPAPPSSRLLRTSRLCLSPSNTRWFVPSWNSLRATRATSGRSPLPACQPASTTSSGSGACSQYGAVREALKRPCRPLSVLDLLYTARIRRFLR